MGFIADKQTLEDLNISGKYKPHSIYSLFNQVKTRGGERLLDEMFSEPLTDPIAINRRSSIFKYFQNKNLEFPFENDVFSGIEDYLDMRTAGNIVASMAGTFWKKISGLLLNDDQFGILHQGFLVAIAGLNSLRHMIIILGEEKNTPYRKQLQQALSIFGDPRLQWLEVAQREQLSLMKLVKYDYLLRHTLSREMEQLLTIVYQMDVYIAVSNVARIKGFSYAKALPKDHSRYEVESLRHPDLENAVPNSLVFNKECNLLFLTGVNMAGKSTFMKAFGISVYLAHMGFPVAAAQMVFSVKEGIYSSINVPDNLNLGLSHFYAEVLRVKKVAEEVGSGKNLVVLFDELFKGTNVKDAYDGTLAVTKAFAKYHNCFYIVSTHIIEVGEALKQAGSHLQFRYLPTVMEGDRPRYTYRLTEGITSDRQGMTIIENEGIIKMLQESVI